MSLESRLGGFKYVLICFIFYPYLGEDSRFDLHFSKGLVQAPPRVAWNPPPRHDNNSSMASQISAMARP